jgi:hypothetical protein
LRRSLGQRTAAVYRAELRCSGLRFRGIDIRGVLGGGIGRRHDLERRDHGSAVHIECDRRSRQRQLRYR